HGGESAGRREQEQQGKTGAHDHLENILRCRWAWIPYPNRPRGVEEKRRHSSPPPGRALDAPARDREDSSRPIMTDGDEEDFAARLAASEAGAAKRQRRLAAGDVVRGHVISIGATTAFVAA